MSTVVLLSAARRKREAASEPAPPLAGPKVVILPVVRIERHAENEAVPAAPDTVPGRGRKVH